jgi:hypothetical protein
MCAQACRARHRARPARRRLSSCGAPRPPTVASPGLGRLTSSVSWCRRSRPSDSAGDLQGSGPGPVRAAAGASGNAVRPGAPRGHPQAPGLERGRSAVAGCVPARALSARRWIGAADRFRLVAIVAQVAGSEAAADLSPTESLDPDLARKQASEWCPTTGIGRPRAGFRFAPECGNVRQESL